MSGLYIGFFLKLIVICYFCLTVGFFLIFIGTKFKKFIIDMM